MLTAPYAGVGGMGAVRRSLLASATAIALFATSSAAIAQCTDTFNTAFIRADGTGPTIPYQHLFPLGVGASLNAVVSTMNTINTAFLAPSSSFVTARGDAQPGQLGGGVWTRSVVGTVDTKSTTTGTVDASAARGLSFGGVLVPADPVTGKGTCKGNLHEHYFGYQFGFDIASLNVGGSGGNLHFGLTGGYFDSRAKDVTDSQTVSRLLPGALTESVFTSPAGSFKADTQAPFLGLYSVFTQGNFFADALVRQDIYVMSFSDPLNGLTNQSQNAYGISAGGSAGYKISLPSSWFIEPSGGMLWSYVKVDSITTPGSATFQFLNAGTVKIDDIESILGRVSLRAGTTVTTGSLTWQPFVTGSVFHEFADEATGRSRIAGPANSATACPPGNAVPNCPTGSFFPNSYNNQILSTSTSRVGTFYQLGIGTATVFGSSGWLGYARADYKTGDNVEGLSFNSGLRYNW